MAIDKQAILEKIRQTDRLPMLPTVAAQIIELSNDPDLYPEKVSPVIANDPVLAAKLLGVANSSMFPFRREITNLGEALSVLGIELTMSIAIGFALVDMMREQESPDSAFNHEAFWRKSILGAVAAIEMKSELGDVQQGDLFVCSLMQDIGIVALETIVGRQYVAMVNGARSHLDLVELERRAFGMDHAEIGTAVLERWGLPEIHRNALLHSHDLLESKPLDAMDDLQFGVSFSGMLAEQWIAESTQTDELDSKIHSCLSRISEQGLQRTTEKAIEAIPAASQVFKMQLLEPDQLARVA